MEIKLKLIEKLKKWIIETNIINYDIEIGFDFDDKEIETLRDGKTKKEVYIVSFKTIDNIEYDKKGEIVSLIEGMYCFALFDATTLEMLYIQKKAGYIEVDGSF